MKYIAVVLAALVLVLGTHAVSRAEAPAGALRWEYLQVIPHEGMKYFGWRADGSDVEARQKERLQGFNVTLAPAGQDILGMVPAYGREGWEYEGQVPLFNGELKLYLFKRPLR